jgi:hypothetical protein
LNYKTLLPQRITPQNFETRETISTLTATAYFKAKFKPITWAVQGTYAQDPFDLTMLGGYAVRDSIDADRGFVTYSPFGVFAIWSDLHTNGKKLQVGLLAAYSDNLGSLDPIAGPIYCRGSNIDYAVRLAPRLIYNVGKFRIAPEVEWDLAAYGTVNPEGKVENATQVSSVRFLIGVYYFFNSKIL